MRYRKEQIKVQIDRYGKLKIVGERPLEGNRWSRFRKEFQVPENCNRSEIRAKFENGHLNVLLPITEVKGQEQPAEAPQEPKESQKPAAEPKPSTGQDDMNHKATVKPNGVAKKQEDEKKGEPVGAKKDAQKEGEKEKDQTEEKKHEEKVTGAVGHEEGGKGDAVPDGRKKEEVSEPAANGNGGNGERKLKHKLDELGLDFDKQKQILVNGIVAAVLLVGLGWYLTHKLSPMEERGH
ncbi:inactive protein RESTRICTED TEV MOVEMENT 2 [Cocos nucifera]|uniref:Inactive protein RESTRICTED TEV MOVEMENT 2 n=1 Tax=Cocos nucifera TaxID=13894 RepID=A0A8K0N5T9_COCNU|nr:inactive protein RESTRICTED TEV MOVEMENT 2 [Cocos nucifera]